MRVVFRTTFVATVAAAAVQAGAAEPSAVPLDAVSVEGRRDNDTLQLDGPTAGTATRLGLTPRETPATVNILTQETMQQRGERTFTEALRSVAGVTGGNPPSAPTTLSMRGFTNVLYLYDGVRTSGAGTVNRIEDTWNYERIEVLKGPASVLDGDTAIGGIVNFVTKRPDRAVVSREALLSYGSYGSVRVGVGLGNPFGDIGSYRVDFSHNDGKVGTVARDGEKIDHLTTGVRFDFTPATRLDLTVDYLHDDNQGYFGTPLVPSAFATRPTNVVSAPGGLVLDEEIAHNNYNVLDDDNSSSTYTGHARLTHQLTSEWTLRNDTTVNHAYRSFKNSESAVFVAPGLINRDQTYITHNQNYFFDRFDASQRTSLFGHENRLVVGGEYGKSGFDSARRFSNGSATTLAGLRVTANDPNTGYFNDDPGLSVGGGNRTDTTSDVKDGAAFVEDAFKVTDALTAVLGFRHDHINVGRSIRDLNTATFTAFETNYNTNSHRAGVVYALTPEANFYAQYSNATIPVSTPFLLSASAAPFPLSRGKQFEAGLKQSWLDHRLEGTVAVYKITLDNVLSRDENNPNVTVNNGRQSSHGVELDAAWRVTPELALQGNYAALKAKFDNLIEGGGVSRAGDTPPNVPERVANLFATYRIPGLPSEVFVGVNHTSSMFTDNANTIRINGFTTADAAINYFIRPALLSFRVRNLTDKLYATYGGRATTQVLIAPLRTYEVTARVNF